MKKQLLSIFAALSVGTVMAQTASTSWSISQNAAFTNTSVGIRFLDAVDNNVVWVMGYDGFAPRRNYNWVSRTINGGTTWTAGTVYQSTTTPAIGDTANYVPANLEGIDGNTAWVCAFQKGPLPYTSTNQGGGVLYRTTNGGTTWSNMTGTGMFTNTTSSFANFVTFLTPSVGITVGDPVGGSYEIWRTTNGGLSWSAIPAASIPAPGSGEYAIVNLYAKYGTSNIWFGTQQGRIFYTTNSGLTWNVSNCGASTSTVTEIAFNSASDGLAYVVNASATFELWSTTNGGATWSMISPTPANIGLNDVCGVPGTNLFVSCGAGNTNTIISYSSDNGVTWTDYGSTGIQYLTVDFANNTSGWSGSFSDNTNPAIGGIWKYTGSAITSTALPTSAFAIAPNLCLTGPSASVVPTNSSTGNPAPSYSWSSSPAGPVFSSATATNPTITFATPGTYTISLLTTNSTGTNVSTQIITVQACSLPSVAFTAPTNTICNNGVISTTNSSTGGAPAPSYSWSAIPSAGVTFSPSAIAMNPTLKAATPGTYTITLVGTNSQGTVSTTQTVVVNSCAPNVNFGVPAIFYKCLATDRMVTTNSTAVINGPNTFTWSIQPSSGVSIAPPGVNAQNISANITNTAITIYTITLRATNASGTASAVQTFSVDFFCLGVDESNSISNNLVVFPNPAHDQINITLPSSIESYNVKIVNVLGSVVVDEKVSNTKESTTISLGNKAKGVYFMTIEANREKVTRKIVIE
ncbi:MAG: T9SS type A sorting domain-containing protein [Bacteroidia bacterium]|nr:T9SS type A sorting domain-containing protein [Bacteroidia bacterium]